MDAQPDPSPITPFQPGDSRLETRRGVVERLADPYLTDHDRWVLGQFVRFLDGQTPDPDPRVVPVRPEPARRTNQFLYSRVRRASS